MTSTGLTLEHLSYSVHVTSRVFVLFMCRFMEHLQDEVLELEFNEFSRGMSTISEHDFARILLRYTDLTDDETDEYLHRLGERVLDSKVHLHFICTFCSLNNDM